MLKFIVVCLMAFFVFGCATTPTNSVNNRTTQGTYHRVEKGQTLWRISKLYNIDMDELVRANKLSTSSRIQTGQMLFIPRNEGQWNPLSNSGEDFIWPTKGTVINAFSQAPASKGINIKAGYGDPINASRGGKIVFASENLKGFGKTIIIQHDDNFSTVYARNAENLVKVGDTVAQGQLIAKVGVSGRDNMPYLHFEIRKKHIPQNPYYYLPQ